MKKRRKQAAKVAAAPAASPAPEAAVPSLAVYATVKAASAEPLPPGEILAHVGLDADALERAEAVWGERIASDPAALAAYRIELATAEDALARDVPPVDRDPQAWAAFLRAYEAAAEPFAWLAAQDLGVNDVARLVRRWARRCEEDPKLAAEMPALRRRELPPPAVTPAPRRAPWSKAEEPASPVASVSLAGIPSGVPGAPAGIRTTERLDAMAFAALVGALEAAPERRDQVLAERGLTAAAFATIEAAYAKRFAANAEARRDYELFKSGYRERLRRARARVDDVAPNPGSPPDPLHHEDSLRPATAPRPTVDELERTVEMSRPSMSLTLPFHRSPALAPVAAAGARPPRDDAGSTVEAAGLLVPMRLPFDEVEDPGTEQLSHAVAAAWPFHEGASALAGAHEPAAAGSHDGSTAEVVGGVLGASLPFASLTLKQHASLTVELALGLEDAGRTLARYRVTASERVALDAHYAEQMRGDPAVRRAWREACDVYLAWLRG